jgi:hypothetical protein
MYFSMLLYYYIYALALSSLAYTNTLKSKLGCATAHNLDDTNKGDRGENLAINFQPISTLMQIPCPHNIIKERWCDSEKKYCDPEKAACSPEAGHFTQVVYSRSTHVGCAQISFIDKNNLMRHIQACRYRPAGNLIFNN